MAAIALYGSLHSPPSPFGSRPGGCDRWRMGCGRRAGAAACLLASPVFAYPDEEMCDLGFPTASGEYVTIGYKPRVGTSVMITNKHATSLRAGEVKSLVVVFGSEPGRPFTSKHVMPFDVHKVDAQRVLSASPTYKDFLDDFARSGFMAVLTPQGAVVSAIKLDGSSSAVEQLRACAYVAAKLDPQDPFLPKL